MNTKSKDDNSKPRIIILDIEITPSRGFYYGNTWQTNILETTEHWILFSYSWKVLGESKTHFVGITDFKGYKPVDPQKEFPDDYNICKSLNELLDSADIVIGHNSKNFDIKKSNLRFSYHGLPVPSHYEQIDTKVLMKQSMSADSNSLDNLGKFYRIGQKDGAQGPIWQDYLRGDKKAAKMLQNYNNQDILLTEKLYMWIRKWSTTHVNMAKYNKDTDVACTKCGSKDYQKRGWKPAAKMWYQTIWCKQCHSHSRVGKGQQVKPE